MTSGSDARLGWLSAAVRRARTGAAAVLDAVLPRDCPACRSLVHGTGADWCEACAIEILRLTGGPYCPTCGRNVGPFEVVDGRCSRCSGESHRHDGLVRVAAYEGVMRSVIRRYKFGGQQRLDRVLGRMLADRIEGAPWRPDIEAVVPVPSHWRVRWRRGFFSTGSLARHAAHRLGRCCVEVLARPTAGRSQIGLNATERRQNVRGQFVLAKGANVEGRRLCLVDDVMVTGATLQENVRALRKAGAAAVYVAILARVDPSDAPHVDV